MVAQWNPIKDSIFNCTNDYDCTKNNKFTYDSYVCLYKFNQNKTGVCRNCAITDDDENIKTLKKCEGTSCKRDSECLLNICIKPDFNEAAHGTCSAIAFKEKLENKLFWVEVASVSVVGLLLIWIVAICSWQKYKRDKK